jgi:cytochrome o ubiquinol oxidase subunit 1
MPRRMEHYMDPAWLPWLVVAAIGALVILIGIVFLAIQLTVSIRERKQNLDLSGDPWNGRTLEWATASPPAVYNFARIPEVHSLDAYWEMKQQGLDKAPPRPYEDIHMPRNSAIGPVLGAIAFVFGFAMIWHIWWLAGLSALGMLGSVILRSFDDDIEYVIPAAEVERTEQQRLRQLQQAETATSSAPDSQTVLQV